MTGRERRGVLWPRLGRGGGWGLDGGAGLGVRRGRRPGSRRGGWGWHSGGLAGMRRGTALTGRATWGAGLWLDRLGMSDGRLTARAGKRSTKRGTRRRTGQVSRQRRSRSGGRSRASGVVGIRGVGCGDIEPIVHWLCTNGNRVTVVSDEGASARDGLAGSAGAARVEPVRRRPRGGRGRRVW